MTDKIVVPVLGESITEATVAKWLKNKGDSVEADEPVVELETDKVNLEVPSPSDGIISEINAQNGSTVEVGAVLGSIIGGNSKKDESEDKTKEEETTNKEDNVISLKKEAEIKEVETKLFDKEEEISEPKENTKKEEPLILTEEVSSKKEKSKKTDDLSISPAVRKIAADNKIDLKKIQGTGKGGRISKGDLLSLMNVKPAPSERKIKFGQEEKITKLRGDIDKENTESRITLQAGFTEERDNLLQGFNVENMNLQTKNAMELASHQGVVSAQTFKDNAEVMKFIRIITILVLQ